jgi:crossover junction endodeoxyribonuclease RusA
MTAATITFPRPAPLWSINKPLHHMARARLTKAWRNGTVLHTWSWRNSHRTEWNRLKGRPCTVHVTLGFDTDRRRDPHNYTGTVVKAVIDGLVDAGLWPDDTPEWVTVTEPALEVPSSQVAVRIEPREAT